jgi:RNA polymerase sigma factor (TIGR02999 family)
MTPSSAKVTTLLRAWSDGDASARENLIPLVYQELKRIASSYRRRAGVGETLQTTALVNEAYLRLVDIPEVDWKDRVHFFALSAQLMRRILVDAARARKSQKRGGDAPTVRHLDLDLIPAPTSERATELIALDDALTLLTTVDPNRGAIVELRIFGGLTVEETAEALGHSSQKILRDWKLAKAWLLRELDANPARL